MQVMQLIICPNFRPKRRKLLVKSFLIMKLSVFFLILSCLQVCAKGYGQKITLSVINTPAEKVFKEIEKQSSYSFIYAKEQAAKMNAVDLNVVNTDLTTVLNSIFKYQNFTYTISGNNIVVKEKPLSQVNDRLALPTVLVDVSGQVKDADGKPLAGATVKIKGSDKSAIADQNGKFNLSTEENSGILEISYVGFESREVAFSKEKFVAVSLKRKDTKVDEIVIVGYGSQKKINLTGAVNTIKGEEIQKSSSVNVTNALAGRSPGVIATSYSGDPGNDNSAILIRGINSFAGGTSPLIVVDGVPDRDFARLNPADIESINVLKDASAAIYGVRAANGVILVTTKRGSGKTALTYDFTYGVQQFTRLRPTLKNSLDFFTYTNEAYVNEGQTAVYTQAFIDANKGTNTDWFKETLNKSAPQSQHKLTVSGSTEKVNYYVSAQYLNQQSNYKVTDKEYKQFNILSNIDVKANKYVKISLDVNARKQDNKNPTDNPYILMQNIDKSPIWYPVKWSNDLYAQGTSQDSKTNAVIRSSNLPGYSNNTSFIVNTKMGIDIQLPFILKGLSASGYYAYDFFQTNTKSWGTPYHAYDYNRTTNAYIDVFGSTGSGSLAQDNTLTKRITTFAKIAYDQNFGKHNINAFVGYEESSTSGEIVQASRNGFVSTAVDQLYAGNSANQVGTGFGFQDGRKSYLGRLAYGYNNRYLAEVTMRYNGSFNFSPDKRWGLFPAASLGWRISEENFFKDNVKFINNLKLRASWGLLGSDAIAPYQYLQRYTITNSTYYDNFLYTGTNYQQNFQIEGSTSPNVNVTWEKQDSKNIGFDMSLLSNRITLTVDFFKYVRRDILAKRSASVPVYAGLNLPDENIGKMQNQGFDFSINYSERRTKIQYYAGLNFGYTQNKIIFRDEAANIPAWQKSTGFSADSYTIFQTNGIYRSQAEVDKSPHLDKAAPGDIWIKDVSGDGKIDNNDLVRINYSVTPRMTFGIPMGIEYKGFTVDLLWAGQTKAKILMKPGAGTSAPIPSQWIFDGRWTPQNPNAPYPRAFTGNSSRNQIASDLFLIDGSFLRLKSAEIAYNIPGRLYAKLGISNLSVRLSGFNLFSFDHFKKFGRDVENTSVPGTYGSGDNSSYQYPQTRIYQFGLRVGF
jgi:TonB-dependent starch-binding outer membrane protein SusC